MTPEQQDAFLARLRNLADDLANVAAHSRRIVDEHGAVGAPNTFPDKSGNLANIQDDHYLAMVTTAQAFVSWWDSGYDTNAMRVSRFNE